MCGKVEGDLILTLLPDTDQAAAADVAEKVRAAIARIEIPHLGSFTASCGVAALPEDASESDQLIRKADRALYAAKAARRNQVKTAVPPEAISVAAVEDPVAPSSAPPVGAPTHNGALSSAQR